MPEIPLIGDLNPSDVASICAGDAELLDQIIEDCEPRIKALAPKYERPGCSEDELVQAGRIAVWHAALKFESDAGVPFEHYASRAIKNAFVDELRANPAVIQSNDDDDDTDPRPPRGALTPSANTGESAPTATTSCTDGQSPTESALCPPFTWCDHLTPSEFDVIVLLYQCGLTQRETGRMLGISQVAVSKAHRRILDRLADRLVGIS